MRIPAWFAGAALLAAGSATDAAGPSFDCKKAKGGSIEAIICGSSQIAALDVELARLYRLAVKSPAGGRGEALQKEQQDWLAERNRCAKMPAQEICTRDRYLQRIAWLRASQKAARGQDDKGISNGPVPYVCESIDGPLILTFVNTNPPLAYMTRKTQWYTYELAPAGSGAKYASSGGETFWTRRDEALYQPGMNAPEVKCRREKVG